MRAVEHLIFKFTTQALIHPQATVYEWANSIYCIYKNGSMHIMLKHKQAGQTGSKKAVYLPSVRSGYYGPTG